MITLSSKERRQDYRKVLESRNSLCHSRGEKYWNGICTELHFSRHYNEDVLDSLESITKIYPEFMMFEPQPSDHHFSPYWFETNMQIDLVLMFCIEMTNTK